MIPEEAAAGASSGHAPDTRSNRTRPPPRAGPRSAWAAGRAPARGRGAVGRARPAARRAHRSPGHARGRTGPACRLPGSACRRRARGVFRGTGGHGGGPRRARGSGGAVRGTADGPDGGGRAGRGAVLAARGPAPGRTRLGAPRRSLRAGAPRRRSRGTAGQPGTGGGGRQGPLRGAGGGARCAVRGGHRNRRPAPAVHLRTGAGGRGRGRQGGRRAGGGRDGSGTVALRPGVPPLGPAAW